MRNEIRNEKRASAGLASNPMKQRQMNSTGKTTLKSFLRDEMSA